MTYHSIRLLPLLLLVAALGTGPALAGDDLGGVLDDKDPFGEGSDLGDDLSGLEGGPGDLIPSRGALDKGPAPSKTGDRDPTDGLGLDDDDLGDLGLGPEPASATGSVVVSAAAQEVWNVLSALSQRMRTPGFRPLGPARLKALELRLAAAVGTVSGPLGEPCRERWKSLRASLGAGVLPANPDAFSSAAERGGAGFGSPSGASMQAADAAFRRQEDRAVGLLDGWTYGPLPATEVVRMLDSGEDSSVKLALEELKQRGPGALYREVLPRLAQLRAHKTAVQALETAGEVLEESDLPLLERLAGGGDPFDDAAADGLEAVAFSGDGPDLSATGGSLGDPGLREAALRAAGMVQGRVHADSVFAGSSGTAAEMLSELGLRFASSGADRDAALCYLRASRLQPTNPLHFYHRARSLYRLGLFEAAHAVAGKAISVGPADRRYYALQLGALRALGRAKEVKPLLEDALRSAEGGSLRSYLYTQLAIEELADDQPEKALTTLQLARTGFVPTSLEARQATLEAEALLTLGQASRALAKLRRAREQGLGGARLDRLMARLSGDSGSGAALR